MATNLSTLLDAVADALETITPDTRANVTFKRWRGQGPVESAPQTHRMRAFQLRLGKSLTPRTISSFTVQWQRAELLLVVGYVKTEPRQGDSNGLGIDFLPWDDHKQIINKVAIGNVFSAQSNVKRLLLISADEPTETSRTYRFDLEWAESF